MIHQYMLPGPRRRGGPPHPHTHIVVERLDHLPDAFHTLCSHTKRGALVDGPTAETPMCKRCHDMATGTPWRSRDL